MSTPLFRPGDRPLLNLALLAITLLTTSTAFLLNFGGGGSTLAAGLRGAVTFSASLVLILGAHEMGHYVLARIHGVDTTLPYFIPLPLFGVGTLGAVIRIRGPIPNRNALVDIGAAGPIAGLVVAIPILLYGLAHSTVVEAPKTSQPFPAESSLWVLVPQVWHSLADWLNGATGGTAPPAVHPLGWLFGDNLLMRFLQYVLFGSLPQGKDLEAHPMVIAGWFGLLVTMLNLIPIGQLDGGHLSYAILGRRAPALGKLMALLMFGLCLFYSAGWLLWLLVTSKLIGFRHPPVLEPQPPLTAGRKWICATCLIGLIVCVMPAPITLISSP